MTAEGSLLRNNAGTREDLQECERRIRLRSKDANLLICCFVIAGSEQRQRGRVNQFDAFCRCMAAYKQQDGMLKVIAMDNGEAMSK